MAPTDAPRKPPKRHMPARVEPEVAGEMARLAGLNGRRVADEYRAAVDAWIKRNRSKLEAA